MCTTPFAVGHSNRGENPELFTFFNKLLRLCKLPIQIVFVFDGDRKPSIKRGTRVVDRQHFLYRGMVAFIRAFGHEYHTVSICTTAVWAFCFLLLFFVQAPAEAEAELALMNSMGLIDAILTNDSDVFLFGGLDVMHKYIKIARSSL